jgi:hypothetical protein
MTMNLENRVYALRRVASLTERLRALHLLNRRDAETQKAKKSTRTSLRRWEKKLGIVR